MELAHGNKTCTALRVLPVFGRHMMEKRSEPASNIGISFFVRWGLFEVAALMEPASVSCFPPEPRASMGAIGVWCTPSFRRLAHELERISAR